MTDKISFPQIPATVWWGTRSILQKTPSATIDERYLGVQLQVQETAARQYITELRRVGILNDEGKATSVALRWRNDETYWEATQEILRSAYPEGLLNIAPPGEVDRQRIVSWFSREGLGTGAAGNKAATYLLIGTRDPNEPIARTPAPSRNKPEAVSVPKVKKNGQSQTSPLDVMPLNLNIQIHIGADASSDQIESIFSAMKRYLYESTP